MLLAQTLNENIIINDGVINTVIDSSNPLKDFQLLPQDELDIITENDNMLIFVDADINRNEVRSYAITPNSIYYHLVSEKEKNEILKEIGGKHYVNESII